MKQMLIRILSSSALIFALSFPANAISPASDLHAPGQIQIRVMEKQAADLSQQEQRQDQEREEAVKEIQKILRADELDRINTMAEALRQENLSDLTQGHEDLKLAMSEKNVDLHLGKSLTDMHGNRVRMEEYVLRPSDTQVQFMNLTMRDQRLDYINYTATFNTTVPRDTRGLWDKITKTQPSVYLVQEDLSYSNLTDTVALCSKWFEPTWDVLIRRYVLPQKEGSLRVNNILKLGWERASVMEDMHEMAGQVGLKNFEASFIDNNVFATRTKLTFNDDTFLQLDNYRISDQGEIRTLHWGNWTEFVYWMGHINELVFNSYKESIWTATEFEGRTIDTVSQFQHLVDVFENDNQRWR